MSSITEVVLYLSYAPDKVQSRMRENFTERSGLRGSYPERLEKISTKEAGGGKVFGDDLYAGAYNYLPEDDLISWLKGVVKDTYTQGVLVLSHEQADEPTVYVILDGEVVER